MVEGSQENYKIIAYFITYANILTPYCLKKNKRSSKKAKEFMSNLHTSLKIAYC